MRLFFPLILLFSSTCVAQLSCSDLDGAYVIAADETYLGFFGSSFASDSINNQFGSYGNQFGANSVRNNFGSYGSNFASYSANNNFSSNPPYIFRYDELIARLTTNNLITGAVSLDDIDASCNFFSAAPLLPDFTLPADLTGLMATDGEFSDAVFLSWNNVTNASSYKIYYSTSLEGERIYITETTNSSISITGGLPGEIYYYFVFPINSNGEGIGQWATGYVAFPTLPDDLTELTASDGEYIDKVNLSWAVSKNADSYEIYSATTLDGQRIFITETASLSAIIRNGIPGKEYYYFVFPKNSGGSGTGSWDTGYIKNIITTDDSQLARISGLNLKGSGTSSRFSVGMHLFNDSKFISQSTNIDTVSVKGYIYPQISDLNKVADIFIVVNTPVGFYMRNIDGEYVPWNASLKSLEASFENQVLTDGLELELYYGSQSIEGEYKYFIGYMRTDSDELVVTPKATKFTIIDNSSALLWTVSNGINEVIIGGTIHALQESDFPLPQEYFEAFDGSEILVTEIDYEEIQDVDLFLNLFISDDGMSLSDRLSPSVYSELQFYFSKEGYDINNLELFDTNFIGSLILNIELEKYGYSDGVDIYFQGLAYDEGRLILGLGSAASQINILKSQNEHLPDDEIIIRQLINAELGLFEPVVRMMINAWAGGDIPFFENIIDELKSASVKDYNSLLTARNASWIPQIETFLNTKEVELVLVGTLHLIGQDSVIKMLEDRGYTVERYQ